MYKKIKLELKKIDLTSLFLLLFTITFLFTIVFTLLDSNFLNTIFFRDKLDTFMDFFNSIIDARDSQVYVRKVIYPPLTSLMFYFLSRLIPIDILNNSLCNKFVMREEQVPLMLYLFYLIIILILLYQLLCRLQKKQYLKGICSFAILFSYPFLYAIERGNVILISLFFTMIFCFYHNHRNKCIRELALISLAIAANIKLYPALFGLLLLSERNYRAASRTVLYGAVLFVVPFIFYEGMDGVAQFFQNITNFDASKEVITTLNGRTDIKSLITWFFGHSLGMFVNILYYVLCIPLIIFKSKKINKVMIICCMILNFSGISATYNLIFLCIPLLSLFNEEKVNKSMYIYCILICLLLFIIPVIINLNEEIVIMNRLSTIIIVFVLSTFNIIESYYRVYKEWSMK